MHQQITVMICMHIQEVTKKEPLGISVGASANHTDDRIGVGASVRMRSCKRASPKFTHLGPRGPCQRLATRAPLPPASTMTPLWDQPPTLAYMLTLLVHSSPSSWWVVLDS